MPYSEGRVVHDADAHIMETPTWLQDHAEASFRERLPVLRYTSGNELRQTGDPAEQQRDLGSAFDRLREKHASAAYRADEEAEIMARKNFAATGSFIAEDRPRALDLLGFSSQLVFNTFHNGRLFDWEHGGDLELAYGAARAHNRGMLEFCSVDPRLLPSLYVPLVEPEQAVAATRDALEQGAIGRAQRLLARHTESLAIHLEEELRNVTPASSEPAPKRRSGKRKVHHAAS